MKHFIIILTVIFSSSFIISNSSFSQGWEWQNPLPFGDPIEKVFFVNDKHGWMVPENNTLVKTIDSGQNWEIVYTDIMFSDIFFIDELEGWGISRKGVGSEISNIYHTTDGGFIWEIQIENTDVRYDIFFIDYLHGWASGDIRSSPLMYTKDGGKNWQIIANHGFRAGDPGILGITFLDTLNGWAVGGLLYGTHTKDGGKIWQQVPDLKNTLQIIHTDSLHLWALGFRSIRKSINGGQTWEIVEITDTTAEVRSSDIVALNNDTLFVASNIGIFKSINGGSDWTFFSQQGMKSFHFISSLEIWGGGDDGRIAGMYHSLDGGKTWENLIINNISSNFKDLRAVDFVNRQIGWIVGKEGFSNGFILKTENGGETWFEQNYNVTSPLRDLSFVNEEYGWIVGEGGTILHTKDGGQSWISQISGNTLKLQSVHFVDHLHGWVVGGDFVNNNVKGIILHTDDGGEIWSDQSPNLIPRMTDVSFVDSLTGWAVGGGGSVFDWGIILHTNDGGKTWINQREDNGLELYGVEFVDKNNGWAVGWDPQTQKGVIHTEDGGGTWSGQDAFGSDIRFIDTQHGWIISLSGSILSTSDGGQTWLEQSSYADSRTLQGIDFINTTTGWIVGLFGTILHTTTGGGTSVESHFPQTFVPEDFFLYPNYPNPFNQQTQIQFDVVQKNSKFQLLIFDILGRKVTTLFDGELPSGSIKFIWNGKNDQNQKVNSGLYFCRLVTGGKGQTMKMMLFR